MATAIRDTSILTLPQLLQRYAEEGPTAELLSALEERAAYGSCLFAITVANLSLMELEDLRLRLQGASQAPQGPEGPATAAEREVARLQREVVQAEIDRREEFYVQVESGAWYAPSRSRLIQAISRFLRNVTGTGAGADAARTVVAELRVRIRAADKITLAGASRVAHLLREASTLPDPLPDSGPLGVWVRWALVLDVLASGSKLRKFADVAVDPITESAADQVRHLFYAETRQDPRIPSDDWTLDMPGDLAGALMEEAALAHHDWGARCLPEVDLMRYATPSTWEEPGRPQPHASVLWEDEARREAQRSGAILFPMLYKVTPRQRQIVARSLWQHGVPKVTSSMVGLPFYARPGDVRMQWNVRPHPKGILCAIALEPRQILSVGREQDARHEALLHQAKTSAARRQMPGTGTYHELLRDTLYRDGFRAIARYDYQAQDTAIPQELIMLEPLPRHGSPRVYLIRESFPAFAAPIPSPRVPRPSDA